MEKRFDVKIVGIEGEEAPMVDTMMKSVVTLFFADPIESNTDGGITALWRRFPASFIVESVFWKILEF